MEPRAVAVKLVLGLLLVAPLLLAAAGGVGTGSAPGSPGVPAAGTPSVGVQPLVASVGLSLSCLNPSANPTDTVGFVLFFNNTGDQVAPDVWINVSAPSGLLFLSDTASGNASGYPHYHFVSLSLGLHEFQMSFVVAIGTAPGTVLTLSATMVYSDGGGAQHFVGPARASILVGVVEKQLYLGWSVSPVGILTPVPPTGGLVSQGTFTLTKGGPAVNFDLVPVLARPFRALNVSAALYVQPLSTPANMDMSLTLIDVNGAATTPVASVEQVNSVTGPGYWTFFYTFTSMNYLFSAGHQIRLQVLNTGNSQASALLATNATAEPSQIGLQTTTYVSVDSLTPRSSPPTYLSPKSTLVIAANVSDPFGSGEIVSGILNLTGPNGPVNLSPVITVDPSNPSAWKLFRYTESPPLANGTYSLVFTATERNGVVDIAASGFTVRAPAFVFTKVASQPQAKSGTRFTYTLWYNNTGTGPAGTVWINDTLPSQLNFVSSVPNPASNSGSTYRWTAPLVPAGSVNSVVITVQVKGGVSGVAYFRNWASLNFSDERGFLWPYEMSHADVVLNGPVLSLAASSVPSSLAHANQTVTFTFRMTNTGDAANRLWLNDTLPTPLAYANDTSASLGGTRTIAGNVIRFAFSNMPSGASTPVVWSFTLTVQVAPATSGGTDLTSRITLNDTSANGVLMPELVASVPLTAAAPRIASGAIRFGLPSAAPDLRLPVYVNFTNAGNEPAGHVWLSLTLDPDLSFSGSALNATLTNGTVQIAMANVSVGADSAAFVVTVLPSVMEGQVLTVAGTLLAADGYGNAFPSLTLAPASVPVALPDVNFSLTPAAITVEAGTMLRYTVTGGNTGNGTASLVWLNVTLPAGLTYLSDSFGAQLVVLGSNYSWLWTNYVPGSHAYFLNLSATGAAADRSTEDLAFSVQVRDVGGYPEPVASFGGRVTFLAPSWVLSISPDAKTTLAAGTLNYSLRVQNVGSTAARYLWLLVSLDPNVDLITHTAAVPATGTTTLNWTFQDVQPGQVIAFNVLVKVRPGTPGNTLIAEALEAHYTNSNGAVLGYVRALAPEVDVRADVMPLVLILGFGSAAGAGVVILVYRRYRVQIEDVFLIARDGILISHLTNTTTQGKDEDQLSGMLTAVQDFVQDAFTYGGNRELHQMEFGDYHILMERGKSVYLAVVYMGRDSGLIRKKVRAVLDRIEATYGPVFERWDGDMQDVEGTHELLREGFLDEEHPWSLVKPKT